MAEESRQGAVLYFDWFEYVKLLSDTEAGIVLKGFMSAEISLSQGLAPAKFPPEGTEVSQLAITTYNDAISRAEKTAKRRQGKADSLIKAAAARGIKREDWETWTPSEWLRQKFNLQQVADHYAISIDQLLEYTETESRLAISNNKTDLIHHKLTQLLWSKGINPHSESVKARLQMEINEYNQTEESLLEKFEKGENLGLLSYLQDIANKERPSARRGG